MPRQDLPLDPRRMLRYGEVPDPTSDAANVPRAVPQSKQREDRGLSPATPATVSAKSSSSFDIPAKYSNRWWSYDNGSTKKGRGF